MVPYCYMGLGSLQPIWLEAKAGSSPCYLKLHGCKLWYLGYQCISFNTAKTSGRRSTENHFLMLELLWGHFLVQQTCQPATAILLEEQRRNLQSSQLILRTLRGMRLVMTSKTSLLERRTGEPTPLRLGEVGAGVSQEAVTIYTTIVNTLSNLEVVLRLLAVVSPDISSGSGSCTPAADGKLSIQVSLFSICWLITFKYFGASQSSISCSPDYRIFPTGGHASTSRDGLV